MLTCFVVLSMQDGKVSQLEHVFIRGSKVRCVSLSSSSRIISFLVLKCELWFNHHWTPNQFRLFYLFIYLYYIIVWKCPCCRLWCWWRLCCRYMIIPDMLKNAPMFKRLDAKIKVNLFPIAPCLGLTSIPWVHAQFASQNLSLSQSQVYILARFLWANITTFVSRVRDLQVSGLVVAVPQPCRPRLVSISLRIKPLLVLLGIMS